MWKELLTALALLLVLEGIIPFLSPQAWKRLFAELLRASDHVLRVAGLTSMVAGILLLYLVK